VIRWREEADDFSRLFELSSASRLFVGFPLLSLLDRESGKPRRAGVYTFVDKQF
jgi:hypothetical protein